MNHGLVPGLHINSPRSIPEQFWEKFPFLRGARVDHPRESFRPRYTLAMAHPVVQQHYRELMQNIMREIPGLGFVHVWTNDSGAGFEFTTSLYAGRNGGPYLIREWKSDNEIARKAAENVLTYYRLLRDEGKMSNPAFRVICDLGPFYAERKYLVPHLGDGIDAGAFGSFEGSESEEERTRLTAVGAFVHNKIDLGLNSVLGVPYPRIVFERLTAARKAGVNYLLVSVTPKSLAPFDINGEVLRSLQQGREETIDAILMEAAERMVGTLHAEELMTCWDLSDRAFRNYPAGIPYSTFAFPWFRLWIRPFVPNIEAIPEQDREYYERYLLATFNNPARVDLNNDMMWNFLSVKEAEEYKDIVDEQVLPPLELALSHLKKTLANEQCTKQAKDVFEDLSVRLRAAKAYYRTMRNSVAWTEAVHGYLEATSYLRWEEFLLKTRSMVANELENARELLALWEETTIPWMPVARTIETLHIYGASFGEQLKRKIELMECHKDDVPFIDQEYMWRMKDFGGKAGWREI
ncbi:MAG: hypothetical protein V1799_17045 [bacterium]